MFIFLLLKEVNLVPNIKSAKKRVKVIEAKTLQNRIFKTQLHTMPKQKSHRGAAKRFSFTKTGIV